MKAKVLPSMLCGLLLCAAVPSAVAQAEFTQPGRSEIARLLGGRFYLDTYAGRHRRVEEDLFKGHSIWPVGQIQAGKRTFLIAKTIWEEPPEDIPGTGHMSCTLMILERRNGRMRKLGHYGLYGCGTPHIEGRQIRFTAGIFGPAAKPRINRLTLTEKGPPQEAFLDDDHSAVFNSGL